MFDIACGRPQVTIQSRPLGVVSASAELVWDWIFVALAGLRKIVPSVGPLANPSAVLHSLLEGWGVDRTDGGVSGGTLGCEARCSLALQSGGIGVQGRCIQRVGKEMDSAQQANRVLAGVARQRGVVISVPVVVQSGFGIDMLSLKPYRLGWSERIGMQSLTPYVQVHTPVHASLAGV